MENNLFIQLIAKLNKALSRKQINSDIKELQNTPFYVRLIGKLKIGDTRKQLKQDLNQVGQNTTIKVKANVDKKSLKNSYDTARRGLQDSTVNNPINVKIDANTKDLANDLTNVRQVQEQVVNQDGGLKNLVQSYINWNRIVDIIAIAIRKVVSTTADLAKAQNDLQIVTGKSNSEMKSLMQNYNKLAKDLSSTTIQVAESADQWLRQGKTIAETDELIADSVILAKIGQIDEASATEYLTSAMNGFKKEASEVISIVDKLSKVDLMSATSAGGLAESLSKCSSSANIAGVSIDNLIGYIAAVKEVTQKSDSVIGESFKTIMARLGKIKLNEWIDEDGNDISGKINNVEKTLNRFDIKLRSSANEFRNFEDVIYDVGMAWDNFSSVEQNAIANAFGGVYQRENVLTLFENFDRALELSEASVNSAGTAMEKFATYENSLEAATNRLTASFESLAYNTVSSDLLIDLANATAGIVAFVDKTNLLSTGLTALAFTGAIKGLLLLGTKMVSVKNNVVNMSAAMALSTQTTRRNKQENDMLSQSFSALTQKQQMLILSNKDLTTEQRIAILTATGLEQAEAELKLQEMGLITTTGAATSATFSLRGAWEALKLSIASNPIGLIVTALTSVVTIVQQVNQKQEEAIQNAKDAAQTYRDEANSLENLRQEYLDIVDSSETEAKKNEALIEWKKKLVEAYKNEKDAINDVTTARETGLALIDKEQYYNALELLEKNEELYDRAKKVMEHNSFAYTADDFGAGKKAVDKYKDELRELGIEISAENRWWQSSVELDLNTKSAEETKRKLLDALNYFKELTGREAEDIVGILKHSYDTVNKNIEEYSDIYSEGYSAEATKKFYEFTKTAEGALSQVTNSDSFQKWRDKVLEMAGDSEPLKNALEELANDTFLQLSKAADDAADKSKNAGIKLTDLTKVITELGEEMEEFIDTADKFGEAIGKIISGENLDFSEIFELVQLVPELAKEIQKVNGGKFTIDPEILFKAAVEYGKNNNPITQDIENSKKTIEEIKKQIQELESTNGHGWEFENARGTLKNQLRAETEHLETLENLFEIYGDSLNGTLFDEALDGIKDSVDDYNKKIEKAQNAIEKMNDGTALTYDELIELEELFPQISKSATEGTDGYYLQIDVLNDLMDASYEERNAFIQNQIDKTQALAEQTREQIKTKEEYLEILKNLDTKYRNGESSETTKETQAEVDDLNAALKKYDDTLSLLNAMLGKLYETSSANAKSEKDKLQEEIDYYDTLLSAIEKVADKHKEQLEKEKDALQKQKDALKDANDERQRELDLIEARNNLENAKKRKVYVYTEGYGFRQTQDKKAVKEAEKELREAELEIQEADIDKQIDKLDEQIEAFEEYVKQFSDMKSDIEDLITIEKAKNALDLDEQGLLNLPSETAKEIQEGLANALLKKDKEDNKENTKYNDYGNIVADNILKKIGSPLSFKEFAEKWDAVNNVGIPDYSKYVNGSAGNSEVYNNSTKNVTFAPNITVYGGSSEQEIADIAVREFENIYKSAFNAIK